MLANLQEQCQGKRLSVTHFRLVIHSTLVDKLVKFGYAEVLAYQLAHERLQSNLKGGCFTSKRKHLTRDLPQVNNKAGVD